VIGNGSRTARWLPPVVVLAVGWCSGCRDETGVGEDAGPDTDAAGETDGGRDADAWGETDDARDADAGDDRGDVEPDDAADAEALDPDAPRVVLVIIDGARYTETLGDPEARFAPRMAELAGPGCAPGPILNLGPTVTMAGMSAIHTGAWYAWVQDPVTGDVWQGNPTHWEYYRKQLGRPAADAVYVLEDFGGSIWLPSYDPDYGPAYWPTVVARGWSDDGVYDAFADVVTGTAPPFVVVYLSDVDHEGHSGDWAAYTGAVANADAIVGRIWELLEATAPYAGHTTLLVTSDHGRHDDEHGGFSSHGCECRGCRQVTFLALGPGIDPDCPAVDPPRRLIDLTPTIGRILGYDAEASAGAVMDEIFR
jgi:hypothetical protein